MSYRRPLTPPPEARIMDYPLNAEARLAIDMFRLRNLAVSLYCVHLINFERAEQGYFGVEIIQTGGLIPSNNLDFELKPFEEFRATTNIVRTLDVAESHVIDIMYDDLCCLPEIIPEQNRNCFQRHSYSNRVLEPRVIFEPFNTMVFSMV